MSSTRGSRRDEDHMREALRLARESKILPYPNPWVGCVIARGNTVLGRGSHRGPGTSHAEVKALAEAGERARGATLYVNLEPCCHFGRTPPCTNAILQAGIRHVVYAVGDPNPAVAGRGAAILRRHQVEVRRGILETEARAINEVYFKFRQTGLPFITAKIATSLDGKISTRTGESKWITDAAARRRARELRSQHQAVLVGINTILADDPHLGPRIRGAQNPWRVVLDSHLRTPLQSQVLASGRCIIATTATGSIRKRKLLKSAGAEVWQFYGRRVPLEAVLKKLAERGILSVMVEGGAEVLGSFFDCGLVDRMFWFFAPMIIGSLKSRPAIAGRGIDRLAEARKLISTSVEPIGNCWVLRGNASKWALDEPGD
ncbi:MAG TPA: bifunctional diaminohydroxyphosphoribosylaminopyrimidine deaminase/5-amino-6-(5-phosphoribosylamino)uracil reductase RibD [Terriglobia bacterium]|nr:bifunctional diaminohydroxyphosphoribosylaminopyrimidine deaminase/5-amino-6-(5-phosphoribosylamino)uracil reductase RibD [Terriglobia bacterium]